MTAVLGKRFRLPRLLTASRPPRAVVPGEPPQVALSGGERFGAPVVLIAEDDGPTRSLLCDTFALGEFRVLVTSDGDEAWILAQQHRPELAVLDVRMPGRTGLELTRAIRSHPQLRTTRVILVSAQGQEQDVSAGMRDGADAYVVKPFSPRRLLMRARKLVGRA